ncbi:MAG: hypothetical protein QOF30_3039 [Acidimicrobiaceae bacterium]|jgi:hypothetical protein|nr:hypothetical protein [Acidimicrobiaceae bacterium]
MNSNGFPFFRATASRCQRFFALSCWFLNPCRSVRKTDGCRDWAQLVPENERYPIRPSSASCSGDADRRPCRGFFWGVNGRDETIGAVPRAGQSAVYSCICVGASTAWGAALKAKRLDSDRGDGGRRRLAPVGRQAVVSDLPQCRRRGHSSVPAMITVKEDSPHCNRRRRGARVTGESVAPVDPG